MIVVKNRYLTRLLSRLYKAGYYNISIVRRGDHYYLQSLSSDRVSMVVGYIRNSLDLPEKLDIYLEYAMFNKDIIIIREYYDEVNIMGEPEVEFTTTIIARVNPLLDILEYGRQADYLSSILLKPRDRELGVVINLDGETKYEFSLHQVDARVLEGQEPGIYRVKTLYSHLKLMQYLGINTVKIQYKANMPLLLTPYGREDLKIWLAPYVEED